LTESTAKDLSMTGNPKKEKDTKSRESAVAGLPDLSRKLVITLKDVHHPNA